jgi:hypothetical protein
MAWSINAPVKNCGRVRFDDISCGMGFVCNICIAENPDLSGWLIDTK